MELNWSKYIFLSVPTSPPRDINHFSNLPACCVLLRKNLTMIFMLNCFFLLRFCSLPVRKSFVLSLFLLTMSPCLQIFHSKFNHPIPNHSIFFSSWGADWSFAAIWVWCWSCPLTFPLSHLFHCIIVALYLLFKAWEFRWSLLARSSVIDTSSWEARLLFFFFRPLLLLVRCLLLFSSLSLLDA